MVQAQVRVFLLAAVAAGLLAGCEAGQGPFGASSEDDAPRAQTATRLVERDVEAPQVFEANDSALWDGRPSLGGVWVASPDAVDPERVILRNPSNGKFVIGALFRRERMNPGPALQISSDAAAALGILAGQPTDISVIALRREEVAEEAPAPAQPILDEAEPVTAAPLGEIAAAAIDRAEATSTPAAPLAPAAAPAPAAAAPAAAAPAAASPAAPPATGGSLIQIGIFSVEANARRAVETLSKAGVAASIRAEETQGKKFWSVTARGNASTLASVKAAGFGDAYILKR